MRRPCPTIRASPESLREAVEPREDGAPACAIDADEPAAARDLDPDHAENLLEVVFERRGLLVELVEQ
jgi:hypothetical protein